MSNMVPLRTMTIYQTDDGRRIETFKKCAEVDPVIRPGQDKDKDKEFATEETIFVGVVHIMTNVGPKEVKFQIHDVDNINDALKRYYEMSDDAVKKLAEKLEEAQRDTDNQIITAPASVLDELDELDEDSPTSNSGIIIP